MTSVVSPGGYRPPTARRHGKVRQVFESRLCLGNLSCESIGVVSGKLREGCCWSVGEAFDV